MDINNGVVDLTVPQVAQVLQISIHSVYKLIKAGKLESYKVSARGTRVSQDQLKRFRSRGAI